MDTKSVAILVTAPPEDSIRSRAALSKCEALIQTGTNINHIFFYFDAVNNASPASPLHVQWNQFATANNIALIACSTLAEKRLLNRKKSGEFEFAGLSEFYTRLHECTELVNA